MTKKKFKPKKPKKFKVSKKQKNKKTKKTLKKSRAPKISQRFFSVEGIVDKLLLQIVAVITVFGVLMIASAGIVYADVRFDDPYYFLRHQIIWVILGFISLFIFSQVDYHFFRRWSFLIFLASLLPLFVILIPGLATETYGASRWIHLGPISFQPSEMVKLTIILYIAAWCAAKGKKSVANFNEGFLPFITILSLTCILVIIQPDVGTTGMIAVIAISIFYLAGAHWQHILSIFGMGLFSLFILIQIAPYRLARLTSFLNPELDPQGTGYQIKQALIAIGSGGIFGAGLGHSEQKGLYLPEPVGDSIFAIIAEEVGFIGILILLIAFLLFAARGIKIARNAPDLFGHLIAGGIVTWIIVQAIINMAGISGLLPLTGIPLPFISYGGTSILFTLTAIGILLNISKQSMMLERN